MRFLDLKTLDSIDENRFRSTKPFPWINPKGLLTDEGYQLLVRTLPNISYFEKDYGKERKYGQKPHDRYRLSYSSKLGFLDKAWHDFVAELHGPEYKKFIRRMFGVKNFDLRLEWHYAEKGAAVTPHLDGPSNYGAQIFYFMTEEDWHPAWGGQTLILGSDQSIPVESNPETSDFSQVIEAHCIGNNTLIFKNTPKAWHAVREFTPPSGVYRKIFTFFIQKPKPIKQRVKEGIKHLLHLKAV